MEILNDRYKLISKVKDESSGSVFLASDQINNNKRLLLRILNSGTHSDLKLIDYLRKNFITITNIRHPNLLEVYDFDVIRSIGGNNVASKQYFYTYEYINGKNIFTVANNLEMDQRIDLIIQVCKALYHLHRAGYIYRNFDLKSILAVERNEGFQVKLIGLIVDEDIEGITKRRGKNTQFNPDSSMSASSDFYSLGVLIFYILTKENPFKSNFAHLLEKYQKGSSDFKNYNEYNNSTHLIEFIHRLTSPNTNNTFRGIDEVVKEINKITGKAYSFFDKEAINRLTTKTKLIGRDNQFEQLNGWVNELLYNKGQKRVIIVRGEEGIGKSRLLEEMCFYFKLDKVKIYKGSSSENDKSSLEPIIQILKQLLPDASSEDIERYGPELIKVIPDSGVIKNIKPTPALAPDKEEVRLKVRVSSFILDTLEREPAVIIFENAQWLDEFSLKLIDELINNSKQTPIAIIALIRDEDIDKNEPVESYTQNWISSEKGQQLSLGRFNFEETAELVRSLLGIGEAPPVFSTKIFQETIGNPGFIRDAIIALYLEKKLYIEKDGMWSTDYDADSNYSRLVLPSNIHEAVWKRIETLENTVYEVLEMVSIFNLPVPFKIIEMLAQEGSGEILKETLQSLTSLRLIDQKSGDWDYVYDFCSRKVKNEVYHKIKTDKRKSLHKKAADILEIIYELQGRENKDELIYHLLEAGEKQSALKYIIQSADRMKKLYINNRALALLKKGHKLSLDIASHEETIKILYMMGELYQSSGENEKAFECYDKVIEYGKKRKDDVMIIKAKTMSGLIYIGIYQLDKAMDMLAEAKKLSLKMGYAEGYMESIRHICWVLFYKRKFNEVIDSDLITECFVTYPEEQYAYYHAQLYNVLGVIYSAVGKTDEALISYEKSFKLFEKIGDYLEISRPINNIGGIYLDRQDSIKAREYFEKSLQINFQSSGLEQRISKYVNIGITYAMEDNYIKALEYYFKSEELAYEIDYNNTILFIYVSIIEAFTKLSEYYRAYEYLIKAQKCLEEKPDQGWTLPLYYKVAAWLYYHLGVFDESRSYAQKCIDTSEHQDVSENINCQGLLLLMNVNSIGVAADTLEEINRILELYGGTDFIKDRREIIHTFAEMYIERGELKKVPALIEESKRLQSKTDTELLKVELLYLQGKCESGIDGIGKIKEVLSLNNNIKNQYLQWKAYKAIGDIYYALGNDNEAAASYTNAMAILFELVSKVPQCFQRSFLMSHQRCVPRERLISFKKKVLKEWETDLKNQHIWVIDKESELLESFFRGMSASSQVNKDECTLQNKDIEIVDANVKIQNMINSFSWDYQSNLKAIINTAGEIVKADMGYIITIDDNEDHYILTSLNDIKSVNLSDYIFEYVKKERRAVCITNVFGKIVGNADIMLPSDVKGMLCIPILGGNVYINGMMNRRSKDAEDREIKGFIYLSTRSILNGFSNENLEKCKLLANLAFFQIENYFLKMTSSIDKLTGVYTRKYFESVTKEQLKKAEFIKAPFSVIMIDIDKFKSINDTYGHQKGDQVLSSIGKLLIDNIRPSDICCRYGGEEFIILLPDTGLSKAGSIGERLRSAVENARLMGQNIPLTISLGIAEYPKHGEWLDELIGKADQALYYAKESGRNRCLTWNSKICKPTRRVDKLAGIVTGNVIQDQRNVLMLLEIIQLANEGISKQDKIYRLLGRIIEVTEAQNGLLFTADNSLNKLSIIYAREKYYEDWVVDPIFNKKITNKVLASKTGIYLVDWEDAADVDAATGEPIWQSVIAVPILHRDQIKGIVYLTSSIKVKEFGFNEFNLVNSLNDAISVVLSSED